jgi:hypothetical protein
VDHAADLLARIAAGDFDGEYEQDPVSGAYWPRDYQPDYEPYFVLKPGLQAHPRQRRMALCGA